MHRAMAAVGLFLLSLYMLAVLVIPQGYSWG